MDARMIEIPLTRGQFAVLDECDREKVISITRLGPAKWQAVPSLSGRTFYACRASGGQRIWMHRVILDAPPGMDVAHLDGNGLNNTRANLRVATRTQNLANNEQRKSLTGYRGVYAAGGKFQAQIRFRGILRHLGWFNCPEEAAHAYDRAAIEIHGEFARPNF
jgi:HNH endonuclease